MTGAKGRKQPWVWLGRPGQRKETKNNAERTSSPCWSSPKLLQRISEMISRDGCCKALTFTGH
jgi:hypothetical protein